MLVSVSPELTCMLKNQKNAKFWNFKTKCVKFQDSVKGNTTNLKEVLEHGNIILVSGLQCFD